MTPILDSNRYHFTVEEERDDVSYVIVAKIFGDGKVKEFRLAGKSSVERTTKHMASLTESQCEQWMKAVK